MAQRRGLDSSIWAPSQPTPLTRAQALHRFEQACQRLRWKAIDLDNAYQRAGALEQWAFAAQDAERNFKVDFYEFYAWIEQAVVLLLRVFGTAVERAGAGRDRHAYHHNALRALDDAAHPLHGALGRGGANRALWKAKELRNRWKDAAEGETPPLAMYDVGTIVGDVMGGLEAAYAVAAARVREEQADATDATDAVDGWEWMVEPMDWEA